MCRMKFTLARLGIRGFEPELKNAADRLNDLRLPSGEVLSPNALAELCRDMALLPASDDGGLLGYRQVSMTLRYIHPGDRESEAAPSRAVDSIQGCLGSSDHVM